MFKRKHGDYIFAPIIVYSFSTVTSVLFFLFFLVFPSLTLPVIISISLVSYFSFLDNTLDHQMMAGLMQRRLIYGDNLHAILLLEADLNAAFNSCWVSTCSLMPFRLVAFQRNVLVVTRMNVDPAVFKPLSH